MLRTTSGGKLQEDVLTAIEARLAYWTERLLAKERAVGISGEFRNPIEDFQVSSLEDAIQAADLLRRLWHCGDGPIASVLRLLERKGIRIMEDELPAGVYGLSTWADHRLPLIVLDLREDKTTVDRLRFTAAHELAHLLLSFPPSPDLSVEKRCNKFASFFLFPKSAFIEEMGGEHRDSLPLGKVSRKLLCINGSITGGGNLENWTVRVNGVIQPDMHVSLSRGVLRASTRSGLRLIFR